MTLHMISVIYCETLHNLGMRMCGIREVYAGLWELYANFGRYEGFGGVMRDSVILCSSFIVLCASSGELCSNLGVFCSSLSKLGAI